MLQVGSKSGHNSKGEGKTMRFVTSPPNEAGETDLALLDPADPKRMTFVIECAYCGYGMTKGILGGLEVGQYAIAHCPACQKDTTIEAIN